LSRAQTIWRWLNYCIAQGGNFRATAVGKQTPLPGGNMCQLSVSTQAVAVRCSPSKP